MPKDMDIQHLTYPRVVCLQSCLMKLYMTCDVMMIAGRIEEQRHHVCLYGFLDRDGRLLKSPALPKGSVSIPLSGARETCVASFEGIEAWSAVRWDKSIRTGGDVIERWRQCAQCGIALENGTLFDGERRTHSFWDENFLLYAKARSELESMVRGA
eukprot:7379373-Pyramimonas_sp.AAC.1